MSLAPGARLGPYEIAGPLGAGGMGEVYRAKDSRLGRDVAIKLIPAHLSQNAEVRERFEREARTISSLNHPNICTLYDVGREGETEYFVMELLEGESLAARLERGPIKLDEAVRIAAQIAEALAAAHKQGIVHRDLKPANVVLTKTGAKVLDFGIAKLREEQIVDMATRTTPLTSAGAMVGTVQYMSPEQLEGQPVDHRADLFAFGALLYEMVTGKRAFDGQSQASIIAAILDKEPRPVTDVVPATPEPLDRAIRLCLAKDPEQRWQSAGDLARELRWIAEGRTATPPVAVAAAAAAKARMRGRERIAWAVAGVFLVALFGVAALRRPPTAPTQGALRRFVVGSPPEATIAFDGVLQRISPDGRQLVFLASDSKGVSAIWLRPLDSLDAHPIPGTEDGNLPFWSPDGRTLGFFGNGKLMTVPIGGGAPESICDSGDGRGATWGAGGTIVFAPEAAGPLYRVSQSGGERKAVTALDASRKETGHRWPFFLPDGKHFLFVTLPAVHGSFDVFLGSIDSMDRKLLLKASGAPIYAAPGYLIYPRESSLVAQRFDLGRLALDGNPMSLGVAPWPSNWTGAQIASASQDGILTRPEGGFPETHLYWYDRAGTLTGEIPLSPGHYETPSISPDGKRVAFVRGTSAIARDIWLTDIDHPVPSRFTFTPTDQVGLAWSPDGRRIAFGMDREGPMDVFVKGTDGASEETALLTGGAIFNTPTSFSADGRSIVFERPDPKTGWDVMTLPSDGHGAPSPVISGPGSQRAAYVSPDGRWVAYTSDESGRAELYVQSFPGGGARAQVSTGGDASVAKRWTANGRELITIAGDSITFVAVDVTTGPTFHAGVQHPLFKIRPDNWGWDIAPDGKHVLVVAPAGEPKRPSIAVDVDWIAGLKR